MLSPDQMEAIGERYEMLEARSAYLYDALMACRKIAKRGLLPDVDREETLREVWDKVSRTERFLKQVTDADRRTGFTVEQEDAEALAQFAAAGYSMAAMSPEGQLRVIGARKRQSVAEAKTLREHGEALLRLHTSHPDAKPDDAREEL